MDDWRALRAAASRSADGATVALVFATIDFEALISNWACHALHVGARWFVLVAMDKCVTDINEGISTCRRWGPGWYGENMTCARV